MGDQPRRWSYRAASWVLIATLGIAALPGIPLLRIGDLVVAITGLNPGVYRVTPKGAAERMVTLDFPNAVSMAENNTDVIAPLADYASAFQSNAVFRIAPDGLVVATLATINGAQPTAVDRRADGDWLVFASTANAALRVPAAGGAPTTLHKLPSGVLNAGVFDVELGGAVLGAHAIPPGGGLVHVADDGTATTIAWGLGRVTAIAADWARGDFVVTRANAPQVLRVDRAGVVTTFATFFGAATARVAPDRTVWVAGVGACAQFAPDGAVLTSFALPGDATGIAVYGSRTLAADGSATKGSTVTLRIHSRDPIDGSAPYVLAASTAMRPAIPLGGTRALALAPTPLFGLTLSTPPPFLQRFTGRLDVFGRASAAIVVPPGVAGSRVFVGGVVFGVTRITTVLGPIAVEFR